jgi:hypothetical protein
VQGRTAHHGEQDAGPSVGAPRRARDAEGATGAEDSHHANRRTEQDDQTGLKRGPSRRMISKSMALRLERLEQQRPLTDVVKFWQIVTIDSAGNLEHGPGYRFPLLPKNGYRPSNRWQKTRYR